MEAGGAERGQGCAHGGRDEGEGLGRGVGAGGGKCGQESRCEQGDDAVIGHFRAGQDRWGLGQVEEIGQGMVEAAETLEDVVAVSEGGLIGSGGFVVFWWFVCEQVDELFAEDGNMGSLVLRGILSATVDSP